MSKKTQNIGLAN